MKFRGTVAAAVSLSFTFLCTNFVFAQNTANNEILVYPPKKPPVTKKWYLPLEFGEGRFTTGVYSGLNRFSRRRVDADKLDPFADRPLPTRKRESSSFKPGTWNWRPGMKRPAFSYKYKIINLTKDAQGSYEGMPGDYRQNYRPIPHVRFGGTFAPIPPLMGDPTQHRRGWYIKKYAEKRPKKEQYNQYVMDIVNDKIDESYPSLEWVTYSWKHPHKWKYNLTEDKVRPRFGSYEAFSNYDSRFPAYEPKKRYEVIKIPVVPPIHKRIPDWIKKAEHRAFSSKNKSSEEDSSPFKKNIRLHPVWQHFTLLPRRKSYFRSKQHHVHDQKKEQDHPFDAKIKSSEELPHSFKNKKLSHMAWQHRTYVPYQAQNFETQNPRPPRKDGHLWNAYSEPFKKWKAKSKAQKRPTQKWKPWFMMDDQKPKSTRIPVTFRNYQSPLKFPDEPEVSESMTTKYKTYPPDFYMMPNSSEYDYSVPGNGGWVGSEFERKRFRGYRPAGIDFNSYYQDYYSEYADWYMKRHQNRSAEYYNIMNEDYYREHGYKLTWRPRWKSRRNTKTPRPIVSLALKDFAKKMDKKFEKYLRKEFSRFPNTTNKNIFRDISAHLKAVKEDSLEMQTVGNVPFRLFHPPDSFFHTDTREAIDTSSMERVLLHGLPPHASDEEKMHQKIREKMKKAMRNRMRILKYKQQIKDMAGKIESLEKKSQKKSDTNLLKELKDDQSFIRQMRLEYMKKSCSKNVVSRLKDGFLKIGSMFGGLFLRKKPIHSNKTTTIKHKTEH